MPVDTAQIIRKEIKLTIRVPKGIQWDFMKEFGDAFRNKSTNQTRPVDSYDDDDWYWFIKITIPENDENQFHIFCKNFFKTRGIKYQQ